MRALRLRGLAAIGVSVFLLLSGPASSADDAPPVAIGYSIVATYPHDRGAFTQGLVYADGALYESTGLYGRSSVRRVDLASGATQLIHPLPDRYFAEGLTVFGDRLIQLTWRAGSAFVYRRRDFQPVGEFRYAGAGWGLTQDGRHLIMSDGSATLSFRDPINFAEVRRVRVHDDQGPVNFLNELEFVGGEIFANVWRSPRILRIDAQSGRVTGVIDLSALVERMRDEPSSDVLNGIAYIPGSGRFLVTGKQWPTLFAITLSEDR